jgi:hypothetical protein
MSLLFHNKLRPQKIIIWRPCAKGLKNTFPTLVMKSADMHSGTQEVNIYLHKLTQNAIVHLRIFIWFVRSQGIEFDVEAFCEAFSHIYELHLQTKATRGLHNCFGCYSFAYRRGSIFPALAYRSKWPNGWAKEWLRMKNDLTARAEISGIIQSPIVTSFGFKKPTCYVNFEA